MGGVWGGLARSKVWAVRQARLRKKTSSLRNILSIPFLAGSGRGARGLNFQNGAPLRREVFFRGGLNLCGSHSKHGVELGVDQGRVAIGDGILRELPGAAERALHGMDGVGADLRFDTGE